MKITKANNVLIETTNRVNGMLEQGGVKGRVVSYPLIGVMKATWLSRKEIEEADPTDICESYELSIAGACAIEMTGKVIRKGIVIQ